MFKASYHIDHHCCGLTLSNAYHICSTTMRTRSCSSSSPRHLQRKEKAAVPSFGPETVINTTCSGIIEVETWSRRDGGKERIPSPSARCQTRVLFLTHPLQLRQWLSAAASSACVCRALRRCRYVCGEGKAGPIWLRDPSWRPLFLWLW